MAMRGIDACEILARAFGIDPRNMPIARIVIDAKVGELLKAYITINADKRHIATSINNWPIRL